MNQKQLLTLLVVGLLLGGLALYFSKSRQAEFQTRDVGVGEKLLGDFPANDVGQVTLRSRDGQVNLVKRDVWAVQERSGYPASFSEISELVRKLWELKPAQSQKAGQSQWGRLELLDPSTPDAGTNTATVVELKDKDGKPIRTVLLGKKQMRDSGGQFGGFPVGRWVALPDNKETVFVVSEAFSEVESKPENWLNKDFFKVEKLQSISLVSTNATNSWTLERPSESGDWTLVDAREGETLDKSKVSSFNWAFSSPSFNDVHARDADPVKEAFAHPTTLKLSTFEGFQYTVQVGTQPDSDSFYLTVAASADLPKERTAPADETPEDKEKNDKAWTEQQDKLKEKLKKEKALGDWVYKVSKWTVDSVMKDRGALLAEAKADDANAAASGDGDAGADDLSTLNPPLPELPGPVEVQTPLALPPLPEKPKAEVE